MKIPVKLSIILISLIALTTLTSPQKSFAHTGEQTLIEMTADGYFPQNLEIHQGDTITFQNLDSQPHWPASDIHPTHQIYPEFDPQREIPSGQSWQFRFTKAGTWRYHDHLSPQTVGEITVEADPDFISETPREKPLPQRLAEAFEEIKTVLLEKYYLFFPSQMDKQLKSLNIHTLATENKNDQLQRNLKLFGSKRIMEKLINDSGGGSIVDCHQEAHRIGRVAYELFGAQVFRHSTLDCHSGFIHGAMESFLREKGTQNLAIDIKKLCSVFPTSFGNFECLHGVGHGVLAYDRYDLPKALESCKKSGDSFTQSSCYGGVFMENIVTAEGNGAGEGHETKWVSSDPHFPCNAVDDSSDIQTQCYLMQTSRMLDISDHDFDYVVKECRSAPEDMHTICYQSVGRDAAGQTLRDPAKILEICKKVPREFFDNCITGGLYVIVEFWGDQMGSRPHQLCKLLNNPTDKKDCYSTLGARLPGIYGASQGEIIQGCQYVEESYRESCKSAAGLST